HHHGQFGIVADELPGRGDPVEARQVNVDQHQVELVWPELAGDLERLFAVGRFADDVDAGCLVDRLAHAAAKERVTVHDQNPQRRLVRVHVDESPDTTSLATASPGRCA